MSRSTGDQHSPREAIRIAQLYVDWAPNDPVARLQLAEAQYRVRNFQEARKNFEVAISLQPSNASARLRYATVLETMGEQDDLGTQLVQIARHADDSMEILEAGRRALRLPELTTVEHLAPVLLELALERSKRSIYRELVVEVYAHWIRRTNIQGRTPTQTQWLKALVERGLRPITLALASQNLAARSNALEILHVTSPEVAAPALIRLLNAHDGVAKFKSLIILARIGAASARTHMERLVESSKLLSEAAIWALGALPKSETSTTLHQLITNTHDIRKTRMATLAIGARRQRGGAAAIRPLLQHNSMQRHAAWALGALGDTTALDALLPLITSNTEPDEAIIWAIGALGSATAVPVLTAHLLSGPQSNQRMLRWALTDACEKRLYA